MVNITDLEEAVKGGPFAQTYNLAIKALQVKHNNFMEKAYLAGLGIVFISGVMLYSFSDRGETIGTALMTGPAGVLIGEGNQARKKREKEKNEDNE